MTILSRESKDCSPIVPTDTEFVHFRLQGAALDPESICGTTRTADLATSFAQNSKDVIAFGFFESSSSGMICRMIPEFKDGYLQNGAATEDNRAFDEILKLPNIPRPVPLLKGAHGLGRDSFDLTAHLLCMLLRKMPDQTRNVVGSLAE